MPTEHPETTMKYAMEQTTSALAPVPDLVPAAVVVGRRRRRRTRVLTATAAACLTVLAAVAVPAAWPDNSSPTRTGPAKPDPARPSGWLPPLTELTPAAKSYPVWANPNMPSGDLPGMPGDQKFSAEEERLRGIYRNRVAAALERLLAIPGATWEVGRDIVSGYGVVMPDGTRHPLAIDILATGRAHSLLEPEGLRCDVPRMREPDRASCVEHVLPNGTIARIYKSVSPMATSPAGDIRYGDTDVTIDTGMLNPLPVPLTDTQVLTILTDPELLQLTEFLVTHKLYEGAKQKPHTN
ncbi:hypothetical protein [Embleya sp. NBC_00896]|uniref:hypothetical protein n=1 Tax=Embleya sp. NBC_00896 TaxID=2975961 RepID=UPI003870C9A1|nr:hypothetical protein OG928_32475 [Embleya sp. NBC_00896]